MMPRLRFAIAVVMVVVAGYAALGQAKPPEAAPAASSTTQADAGPTTSPEWTVVLDRREDLTAVLSDNKANLSRRITAKRLLENRWPDGETLALFRRVRDNLDDDGRPSWMRRYLDAAILRLEYRLARPATQPEGPVAP